MTGAMKEVQKCKNIPGYLVRSSYYTTITMSKVETLTVPCVALVAMRHVVPPMYRDVRCDLSTP